MTRYQKIAAAFALILGGMIAGSPVAIQTGYGLGLEASRELSQDQED